MAAKAKKVELTEAFIKSFYWRFYNLVKYLR